MSTELTLPTVDSGHGQILLLGVTGSQAYGLATPESDTDMLGMYSIHTTLLFDIFSAKKNTIDGKTDVGDYTMHEAAKYCALAAACNPTVLELMWLNNYLIKTEWGQRLIDIRTSFLSAKQVRDAYLGYATQQFRRLEARGDGSFSADTRKRTAKHARHMARLLHQGKMLYSIGELPVLLPNPGWYHSFGELVAEGNLDAAKFELRKAELAFDVWTPLPDKPDLDTINDYLRDLRMCML